MGREREREWKGVWRNKSLTTSFTSFLLVTARMLEQNMSRYTQVYSILDHCICVCRSNNYDPFAGYCDHSFPWKLVNLCGCVWNLNNFYWRIIGMIALFNVVSRFCFLNSFCRGQRENLFGYGIRVRLFWKMRWVFIFKSLCCWKTTILRLEAAIELWVVWVYLIFYLCMRGIYAYDCVLMNTTDFAFYEY